MISTDVCIIGAGPSGASTSLMLSKLKIKHCIVDKATFPRDKTCGDGLILYAYKSLRMLDEDLFQEFLQHPKFLHSKKIKLHIKDDLHIEFKEDEHRDMIISYAKRFDFDNFLVQHLSVAYAHQEFGNGVKSLQAQDSGILVTLKNGKKILAKMVVGADGVQSIVSRKLAKNKTDRTRMSTFVSGYFKGVQGMPEGNDAEVRIVYKGMPLFFYIFPLADGQVNVSLGGRADRLTKLSINLIDEVEAILSNHPAISHRFTQANREGAWRGWSIPFHFGAQRIYGDRFVLVGDAAGLANAFYKEGVGTGMMSGIIAAKQIEQCIAQNNFSGRFMRPYEKELKKEFSKLLRFSEFALKTAKYRGLFARTSKLFKKRVERKTPGVVKRRSY